jgi:hypothetical protein
MRVKICILKWQSLPPNSHPAKGWGIDVSLGYAGSGKPVGRTKSSVLFNLSFNGVSDP